MKEVFDREAALDDISRATNQSREEVETGVHELQRSLGLSEQDAIESLLPLAKAKCTPA